MWADFPAKAAYTPCPGGVPGAIVRAMPNHLLRGLGLLLVGATLNDLGRRLHERLLPAEEPPGRMIVQVLGTGAGSFWRDFGESWSNSDPKRGDWLTLGPDLDFQVTQVYLDPFANVSVAQCHTGDSIDPGVRRELVQRGFHQTPLSTILRGLS